MTGLLNRQKYYISIPCYANYYGSVPRIRFVIVWAVLVTFGFVLGAVFSPPNPFTQVWVAVGVLPSGAVIAWIW